MFEEMVVSSPHPNKTNKPWTVVVSMVAQTIFLAILILIPLIYTEALPKTMMATMLTAPPPPPPPPPPPVQAQVVHVKPQVHLMDAGKLVQPKAIPKDIKIIKEDAPDVNAGMQGGVPGGIAGGSMGGVVGGVIGGMGGAPPPPSPAMAEEEAVEEAREESEPVAEGKALGDLFEYKLKERVTIRKNQSALVPILQTDIAAEKVSLWSESLGVARPLHALWVNNASPLTLDGGSFSVLDGNTFAGEGLVEAFKPRG